MSSFTIRRLGYAIGAEITGIDLARPLAAPVVAELREAWLEHIVLCFPGQAISPDAFLAFCRYFGEPTENSFSESQHPEFPQLMLLTNVPTKIKNTTVTPNAGGPQWHSDRQYTLYPATGTFLLAKELPDIGGNPMFSNMYSAYDTLSPGMRRLIDPLEAVHDTVNSIAFQVMTPQQQAQARIADPPVVHPLVRVHPETGRKALFIGKRVSKFVGMTEEETKPLLDFLTAHATRYELIYRHRWTLHDLVMWDNRCALHYAVPDYDQRQARRLLRCTLLPPRSGHVYVEEGDVRSEPAVLTSTNSPS